MKLSAYANYDGVRLINSMQELDLLLTPALASDPVAVGEFDSRGDALDYHHWAAQGAAFAPFAYVCNMTGQSSPSV